MAPNNAPSPGSEYSRAVGDQTDGPILERDRKVVKRSDSRTRYINIAEAPEILDAPLGTPMRVQIYRDRIVIRRLEDVLEGE